MGGGVWIGLIDRECDGRMKMSVRNQGIRRQRRVGVGVTGRVINCTGRVGGLGLELTMALAFVMVLTVDGYTYG